HAHAGAQGHARAFQRQHQAGRAAGAAGRHGRAEHLAHVGGERFPGRDPVALGRQQRLDLHHRGEPQQQEAEREDGDDGRVQPQARAGGDGEDGLAGREVEAAEAQHKREGEHADEPLHGATPVTGAGAGASERLVMAASAPGFNSAGSASPWTASAARKAPMPAVMAPKSSAAAARPALSRRPGSSRHRATTSGSAVKEPACSPRPLAARKRTTASSLRPAYVAAITGRPTASASSVLAGPALPTITSQAASGSSMRSTKPSALTLSDSPA